MKITDLSRAELAEWIADWFIYDTRRGVGLDGLVYEIGEGVHGGHWFGIRNELLDAYAATTQPPPPGQERAEGERCQTCGGLGWTYADPHVDGDPCPDCAAGGWE